MQARKIYHLGTEKLSLRYRKVTNVGIAKLSFKYRKVKNIGTENLGMISDVTFFFLYFCAQWAFVAFYNVWIFTMP